METHDVTVMKRIGYVLFLIVILLYMFGGSGEAEILDAAENARTILTFGKYEQDNNPDNGPEEIEWIVLEEHDGNLLLLSRYGLDAVPYSENILRAARVGNARWNALASSITSPPPTPVMVFSAHVWLTSATFLSWA